MQLLSLFYPFMILFYSTSIFSLLFIRWSLINFLGSLWPKALVLFESRIRSSCIFFFLIYSLSILLSYFLFIKVLLILRTLNSSIYYFSTLINPLDLDFPIDLLISAIWINLFDFYVIIKLYRLICNYFELLFIIQMGIVKGFLKIWGVRVQLKF